MEKFYRCRCLKKVYILVLLTFLSKNWGRIAQDFDFDRKYKSSIVCLFFCNKNPNLLQKEEKKNP